MSSTTNLQAPRIIGDHESDVHDVDQDAPRLRKGAKSKYIIEEHPILDGIAKVVRTRHTGDVYHCFFYVKEEQKWLRKSLRTKILSEAIERGKDLVIETRAMLKVGMRIFSKTIGDAVQEYLDEKQAEADAGLITQGRVSTIKTTLTTWGTTFAGGAGKSIDSFDGIEWKRYYVWRRNQKSSVQDVTLVNERAMIASFYKFADQKRYITQKNMPIWDRSISKNRDVARRDAFTIDEYKRVCRVIRYLDKHGKNDEDKENRRFIRDFFLIASNTGLRFGELRKLKWSQVKIYKHKGEDGEELRMCELYLNKADTKNRKARIVQGMRGDVFDRIKEYSQWTKSGDYVFVNNTTGEQLERKHYYELWGELKKRSGLSDREKLTWYSCRHSYATFRLLYADGLDIFTLAKNMGTSVKFIEDHYGHVETAQKRKQLISRKLVDFIDVTED